MATRDKDDLMKRQFNQLRLKKKVCRYSEVPSLHLNILHARLFPCIFICVILAVSFSNELLQNVML